MPTDKSKIQTILVISLSNIGDIILTTPVMSLLRDQFLESQITVLAGPKGAPILEKSKTINEVIIFNKKASLKDQIALVMSLRNKKFDLVVDLRNTAIPFFLWPKYRTSFFVDRRTLSMRQRHLDQLRFLLPVSSSENRFEFFNEEEKKSAFQKLTATQKGTGRKLLPVPFWDRSNDFAIVAPGAGSHLKRWTISGFSQLIDHLNQKGTAVFLVGDQSERSLGEELMPKISKQNANLMGLLTLRESAALIGQASLVIANDSAIMHLAHELNRPTLSIFGPTNEKKYGQTGRNRRMVRLHLDCTPCEKAQCQIERRKCLDDLAASLVIQACEDLLSKEISVIPAKAGIQESSSLDPGLRRGDNRESLKS
jgi:lipopolysaccharide heptosyltransferase II